MGGLSSGETSTFQLATDANIVGEEDGTQRLEQDVSLSTGWNMIGDPFVYPVYGARFWSTMKGRPILWTRQSIIIG